MRKYSGKSSGLYGSSNEYLKFFYTTLAPYLQRVFTKAATTSSFPSEMLRAYVVTILKPGKDPNTPANFGTISFLNTKVKVYSNILAKHPADIIPFLMQWDQMGFLRGQQTSDATRRILNLHNIHFSEKT